MGKNCKKSFFSLLEILIALGILGVFLYLCSSTLISTLMMKDLLESQYSKEKVESTGWHILYQDLANIVGIYYLDGTDWAGIAKKPAKGAKAKKKKSPKSRAMSMDLFDYVSEANEGEPFLSLIVSKGRMRTTVDPSALGFRRVEYFITEHPDRNTEGQVIYRVESMWKEGKKDGLEEDEDINFSDNYRKYIILENIEDIQHFVYSGTEWIEEWNSTKKKDLPIALKIEYRKVGEDKTLERVIPIPISYQIVGEPVDGDL